MAIMMLPDKQRRRLLMHYWGGMSYEEMGEAEGCSKTAISYSIETAKRKLKKLLEFFQK